MNIDNIIKLYKSVPQGTDPVITGLGFNKNVIKSFEDLPSFQIASGTLSLAGMPVSEINSIEPHQMILYYESGDYAIYDLNKRAITNKFNNPFKTDIELLTSFPLRKFC